MLEPLTDLPDGVIGFEAVGEVHADDYQDVLRPALDQAADAGSIRMVYVLGDRFEGYSAGAGWEDAKLAGLAATHHGAWKRTALVSDADWISHAATLFGWMMPGEFKHFGVADQAAAVRWVAG